MAQTRANPQFRIVFEVLGFVLVGIGLLLLLSLISYAPADVPSWFPLSQVSKATRSGGNFIGPFGAILACVFYTLLGAAAYLLAAMMLGWGGTWMFVPQFRFTGRWVGCLGLVVAGACLAHLLGWKMIGATRLALPGEGGYLGKWVGSGVLESVFGRVGSIIVLVGLYGVCLLLLTGVSPVEFLRAVIALPRKTAEKFTEWKLALADAAKAEAANRPPTLEPPKDRRTGRKTEPLEPAQERSPARKRSSTSTPAEELFSLPAGETPAADAEPPRPAPKIFDATALPLAVQAAEKKKERLAPMTPVSCEDYELPPLDLLEPINLEGREAANPDELIAVQKIVVETLAEFGIEVSRGRHHARADHHPLRGVPRQRRPRGSASSPWSATSPAPLAPSGSTSSRRSPARTPSASRSRIRRSKR